MRNADMPAMPIIASRIAAPKKVHSVQSEKNARRMASFHAKWRGQKEARLELWRV